MDSIQQILNRINTTLKSQNQENLQKKKNEEQKKNSYKCNLCKDTGCIIIHNEKAADTIKPCRCKEEGKIKRLWINSGIRTEDIEKTFSNFEIWNESSQNIKNVATNYYLNFEKIKESRKNSILLCGNPGSGKTHIALALANSFMRKKGYKVIYMPYRDAITEIKQNVLDKEQYKKIIGRYQTCEILLIDDLYKGKKTEADLNIMFEIINYRYLNRLPCITSTELTIDEILDYDEAIGSRIYEVSRDYLVEIKGRENNYRLR